MHAQKRAEYKSRLLNPEAAAKLATKARQWNHLSRELLAQRRRLLGPPAPSEGEGTAAEGDGAASVPPSPGILLALTEKMLSVNPDPSHLWNVRREMLLCAPPAGAPSKEGEGEAEGAEEPNARAKRSAFDIEAELKLTAHCLQRNPKSYSSWFHRKWALVHHLTHGAPSPASASPTGESSPQKRHLDGTKSILQAELELCAQFLQLDERNFHCWNYRRFVVALRGSCGGSDASTAPREGDCAAKSNMDLFSGSWSSWLEQSEVSMGAQLSKSAGTAKGILPAGNEEPVDGETNIANSIAPLSQKELEKIITDEWNFTTSKIQDNFSNGSAFHYRSKLLPLMLASRAPSGDAGDRHDAILSLAREEWENILLNAIFTEPDDQTPWWYLRCIVSWAKPGAEWDEERSEEYEALLFEMADSLRELLEVEKENGMVGEGGGVRDESKGAKCKWGYIGLHLVLSTLLESKLIDEDERGELREEAKDCLSQLMQIDPNRNERYQMLAAEMKD